MTDAQALSLQTGKLILIDFYADWCGPCKRMDNEFWSRTDVLNYSDSLIFLKINTDHHKDLAIRFHVKVIPHIALTDVLGDILWFDTGYSGTDTKYMYPLTNSPGDVALLNKSSIPFLQKKETLNDFFQLAKSYQLIGKDLKDGRMKTEFLRLSDKYFKKIENKELLQSREATLRRILNIVYRGAPEKALSRLEKYTDDYFGNELYELESFVKAFCYKQTGETDVYLSQLSHISSPVLINELKESN